MSTSLIDQLRNIIQDDFISSADKGTIITLTEKKEQSTILPIQLRKGNTKTLTLALDEQENINLHPLLNTIKHLKKVPDYLIFCENQQKCPNVLYVLSVELKSSNKEDWHRQAKAGLTFARYLIGMLEGYRKKCWANIEYRCLLFHAPKHNVKSAQNTSKLPKRKKRMHNQKFDYSLHPNLNYLFAKRSCYTDRPFPLEMFLRE